MTFWENIFEDRLTRTPRRHVSARASVTDGFATLGKHPIERSINGSMVAAMTSSFNVHNVYVMSNLWAVEPSCGTGSLTFALAKFPDLAQITAIDFLPGFVEAATRRYTDSRIKIGQADACALLANKTARTAWALLTRKESYAAG
ncbi:class I SAM-dependent methyltransferase [Pseudaminobacter sp. NGMCC 1.201702]|uniref:class I SAM-dependent methyltransferase n=1 Tax=Pseudaminobacter sp. NGMCC 1.201702 TaxID=3391825 RepID=UPI0039EE88ED